MARTLEAVIFKSFLISLQDHEYIIYISDWCKNSAEAPPSRHVHFKEGIVTYYIARYGNIPVPSPSLTRAVKNAASVPSQAESAGQLKGGSLWIQRHVRVNCLCYSNLQDKNTLEFTSRTHFFQYFLQLPFHFRFASAWSETNYGTSALHRLKKAILRSVIFWRD